MTYSIVSMVLLQALGNEVSLHQHAITVHHRAGEDSMLEYYTWLFQYMCPPTSNGFSRRRMTISIRPSEIGTEL